MGGRVAPPIASPRLCPQPVAKHAVDRLSVKLEALRGTGQYVEIAEEVR
jgi:hypothetical protein